MLRPRPLTDLQLPQLVFVSVFVSVFFSPYMSVFTFVSLAVQVLMPRPLSDVPTARLPPQPVPAKNTLPATCTYSNLPPSWRTIHNFLLLQDWLKSFGSLGCQPLPHHLGLPVSVVKQLDRHWLSSRLKGTQLSGCQVSENHGNSKSDQFSELRSAPPRPTAC